MSTSIAIASEPLLRTLAPALRRLQKNLDEWLTSPSKYPQPLMTRAALEGLASDLGRQAEALDVERPLLVIMLMGGTGVGKSTLLNALAGGAIAQASFMRPTTRDPVVYYHDSLRPEQLDPALRQCRLAAHNRPELRQKILVDTPDLDSNDLSNREKLIRLLNVADVVLYVGSQEKYHDRLGWDLFLQHRRRRAFAFVLNKWDRCQHVESGVRPDEDLLRDLRDAGFEKPLLFRTCTQSWVDQAEGKNGTPPPEGEQFRDLVHWLELGLSRLEIEAIKARGVSQLLAHLEQTLEKAQPPDLTEVVGKTRSVWEDLLAEEAEETSEVLLNTLEPYQAEIEQHFALQGQKRFRGLMAGYLHLFTRTKYLGTTLRDRFSLLPKPEGVPETPAGWDLASFTKACSTVAGDRHLDARGRALANRLLVAADKMGFPLELLSDPVEGTAKRDWRHHYALALSETLQQVEREWAQPKGLRRWFHVLIIWLADWLPPLIFLAACIRFLWLYFVSEHMSFHWTDVLLPVLILFLVLVILHVLIVLFLPIRWPAIRGEFRRRLDTRMREELTAGYGAIPDEVAKLLDMERRRAEKLLAETREVGVWLNQREEAASISSMYGK